MKTIAKCKPHKTRPCYVEVLTDEHRYYVQGIDQFKKPIRECYENYDRAIRQYYYELCWMLNDRVMTSNLIKYE